MSSRKHRKQLRRIVPIQLHSVRAARIFFENEHNELLNREFSEIKSTMTIDQIKLRNWLIKTNYFGSAYGEFTSWLFGIIKLSFDLPEHKGKLRAKDLIVKRVQTK